MKKTLLLLVAMIVVLSGCWTGNSKDALAELQEYANSKDTIESIDNDVSLHGMDIKLTNLYKEVPNEAFNMACPYDFYLGSDLYMAVHYFPNEFELSFYEYAHLSVGYFFEKSDFKEVSELVEVNINNIPHIQRTYKKEYKGNEYSGIISYLEVKGGIAAVEIYRLDLKFADEDRAVADEILNTITLNDTEFPMKESATYDIGDKEITLSGYWVKVGVRQEDDLIMKQYANDLLPIIGSVMWSDSGYKKSREDVDSFFDFLEEPKKLYAINIGNEGGYYCIHDDYVNYDKYCHAMDICTSGATYFMAILVDDEDYVLPDEIYHNFAKTFEDAVKMK